LEVKLPNFLIVGAAKSGTTLLYYLLSQHNDVFMPKLKEPHFLSLSALPDKAGEGKYSIGEYISSFVDYQSLFVGADKYKRVGEASVSYLEFPDVTIPNILKHLPSKEETNIIILLRNPIERAYSHYMMKKRDGVENLPFWDAIQFDTIESRLKSGYDFTWDYVSLGFYFEKVKKYMEVFPNVKVLLYEEFVKDMRYYTRDVAVFLGLEVDNFYPVLKFKVNPSGEPRGKIAVVFHKLIFGDNLAKRVFKRFTSYKTRMYIKSLVGSLILKKGAIDRRSKEYLHSIYKDDVRALEKLLGRDLSVWGF
jgi:hypothetical protein